MILIHFFLVGVIMHNDVHFPSKVFLFAQCMRLIHRRCVSGQMCLKAQVIAFFNKISCPMTLFLLLFWLYHLLPNFCHKPFEIGTLWMVYYRQGKRLPQYSRFVTQSSLVTVILLQVGASNEILADCSCDWFLPSLILCLNGHNVYKTPWKWNCKKKCNHKMLYTCVYL